ncbi:BnaA09g24830D [Brassica napus]|uniref:BnaA03g01730D protein n=1 Tax=Brassica napus TaxID=3708 RepID=A0A078FJK9_BRANA|nr:BnaA03g01730D [Brassica napus]CDY12283.1 BnaA09g24830D [Brassica napus]
MPKAAAILELCVFELTIEPELNYGGRLFPASLRCKLLLCPTD